MISLCRTVFIGLSVSRFYSNQNLSYQASLDENKEATDNSVSVGVAETIFTEMRSVQSIISMRIQGHLDLSISLRGYGRVICGSQS
jgi:hypothetical protein